MEDVNLLALLPEPGDDVAVYGPDRDWTRSQLRDRVDAVAEGFDVAPGTAIGCPLPNGGELIATLFAVWKAGGVYVPINLRLTPTEIERIERDVVGTVFDPGVAVVSFTSGTTGPPKPVPLLHARVLEGIDQVLGTLRSRPSNPAKPPMPNLIPVPLGLWNGIYQVLFAFRTGAPVVLMDRFETRQFADLVKHFGIRSTVLPPAAMVMLADDRAHRGSLAAQVRALDLGSAVTVAGRTVPGSVRYQRAQRLRPDRARRRSGGLERR